MDAKKLDKQRQRLYSRVPLVGGWLRRGAAKALAQDGSPEAVRALAEATIHSNDKKVRRLAIKALWQLAGQDHIEAQEALCRLVIEHDHPLTRKAVLGAQYAPRDPRQRALFYFLTGQWDHYEQLDFDRSLLDAIYKDADEGLRRRIAVQARRAGRVEWVEVIAGGRQRRRLEEMTDEEWETTLAVLSRNGQWEEMWHLAQAAPAVWSVQLLRRLRAMGWVPGRDEERGTFTELARLAEECKGEISQSDGLIHCRAAIKALEGRPIAISPDGHVLVTGKYNTVQLWRLPDGAPLKTLEGHFHLAEYLVISPDGQVLVAGGWGGIWLWRLPDGAEIAALEEHKVMSIAISPDGQVLASGGFDKTVRLWRLHDGAELATLEGHTWWVENLVISPDGRILASGQRRSGEYQDPASRCVRMWRLPDGAALETIISGPVNCLTISPDGQLLIGGDKRLVRMWRLSDRKQINWPAGHTDRVTCLAISPDGQVLASGSEDHTVRLWQLPDGAALATLEGHRGGVTSLAISPNGRILASGVGRHSMEGTEYYDPLHFDPTVRLWSLPDGVALRTLEGHEQGVTHLAFSPDGRVLASGSQDGTVRLWMSELVRLGRLPVGQTSLEDMRWVQEALQERGRPEAEQSWLEFTLALMHWHRRFDIEVGEAPVRIPAGEFDIELEE